MSGIWIVAEKKEYALELLSCARSLAAKIGTTLSAFVWKDYEAWHDYIACGADEVVYSAAANSFSFDAWLPVIATEAEKNHPEAILFAATARSKELAARLAARLQTGLCSNCTALSYNETDKNIIMERLAYGGVAIQKLICAARPVMATIPLRTFNPARADAGRNGGRREIAAPSGSHLKIVEQKKMMRETKDITESRVIVVVGRGLDKREDLVLVRKLADALGGEVGCTRSIAEEYHWLSEELCIGLSGVQVKPDLYLGLGVSGQVQHVTGISKAKVIAAVNKDEYAPIFSMADIGIVGDIYDVLPKLIKVLENELTGGS